MAHLICVMGINLLPPLPASTQSAKSLLFYRDFTAYTGGHQKVADYFQHLQSAPGFSASIAFSARTLWDESNPWFPAHAASRLEFNPAPYDYLFLAGMDWQAYLPFVHQCPRPVINFIQHVRHADPSHPLYQFLPNPAVRICVSPEVAAAITATGRVNGPVFTIANGIELPDLSALPKLHDVMILGTKNPLMAQQLADSLIATGLNVAMISRDIPRTQLYQIMAHSRIAVLLPHPTEGFFLPALEAMQFAQLVVVPDCVGNRSFCVDQGNCLMPGYNLAAILAAVAQAQIHLANPAALSAFAASAQATLAEHSLQRERQQFLAILAGMDELWSQTQVHANGQ